MSRRASALVPEEPGTEARGRGYQNGVWAARLSLACLVAANVACRSNSTTSPTDSPSATITVTAAGVSPAEVTIKVGSRVRFLNRDNQGHEFAGGPDPSRPECREIDRVGYLAPGHNWDTGIFEIARTCVYHDHYRIGDPAFQGRIIIQ